ncbi:sigma-70 family RNA polymerase sigma factor [Nocardioides jiangxiensis]|uniref:Sigma-70 family RNA polymerase sigma factor n=1 Tax=Nocardioides jiangxiensis TaxID=3064524 RepID=A0ABT9AY70_9ACTN|nr:sigma-70 family RNA polymerase sigma factor [Nocardioides sp. WY-20]MDO7867355.1 sigma-70 family RNA polymerase sigma factor [Nocardioides sp. WY-20]
MDIDALVLEHLPLVDRCARRFHGWGEPHDDLVQAGRLALLLAARRYDAARGVPFAAYAAPTVLGGMRHHLRDRGALVRTPRGADPLRFDQLDDEASPDGTDPAYEEAELRMLLQPQLARLRPLERDVVALRFLDTLTQDEVAGRLGISQAQVSRVQARALTRLRRRLGAPAVSPPTTPGG